MGVRNFSKNDLTEANLPELVRQLREAVSNREYTTIEQFAAAFASEIATSTIEVADGRRKIDVNGEKVDVTESVSQVMSEIDKTREFSETDPAKVAEYEKMYASVDSQLTVLLMQDKMMEELASRDFSAEKYAEMAVEANAESDRKIEVYNNKIKAYERIEKKVLEPRDVVDEKGNVKKVSLKTKLQDEKDAKIYLEGLQKDIDEIMSLEASINTMEAEIAADPTKEGMYRGKIDANKTLIAQKTTDMKGKVASIKDLHISDLDISSLENCEDPTKVTRVDAKTAIDTLYAGMDARILAAYKKIAVNLRDPSKAGDHTFTPEEIAEIAKIDSTDPAEIEAGKKAIDGAVGKIENEIKRNKQFKKQEEMLKIARTKSTDEYAQTVQRKQELEEKFDTVQKTDADGNLLYLDADGNLTTEEHDADGNPHRRVMVNEPKESTKAQYLTDAGFDLEGKKNDIKSAKKTEIQAMSRREGRALLKENDIGNWFTRIFAYRRLMESQIPRLVEEETRTEIQEVEAEAEEIIKEAKTRDFTELKDARLYVRNTEDVYREAQKKAVTHREMANGAYENNEVLRNRTSNEFTVDAMEDATLEETSLIMAKVLLEGRDLRLYEEARKRYTHKQVAREHNRPTRDFAQNPQHEDMEIGG